MAGCRASTKVDGCAGHCGLTGGLGPGAGRDPSVWCEKAGYCSKANIVIPASAGIQGQRVWLVATEVADTVLAQLDVQALARKAQNFGRSGAVVLSQL